MTPHSPTPAVASHKEYKKVKRYFLYKAKAGNTNKLRIITTIEQQDEHIYCILYSHFV